MSGPDLADVRGLSLPRLALEVALAGQHHLLLRGPQGCGKGMLARRIAGLLPALDDETVRERAALDSHIIATRDPRVAPVRMPHYTVSAAGMLGGGNPPRPGEVSLAHGGVLVLGEAPEFSLTQLQGLESVLVEGFVDIYRANLRRWPARFVLVALACPCPCGYLGHPQQVCTDSPGAVERYESRLDSLMPSFDLVVDVELEADDLDYGEPSRVVARRIADARRWLGGPAQGDTPAERVTNTLLALGHSGDATRAALLGLGFEGEGFAGVGGVA